MYWKASNVHINVLGAGITVANVKRQGPLVQYNLLRELYINQLHMKNKVIFKMWEAPGIRNIPCNKKGCKNQGSQGKI